MTSQETALWRTVSRQPQTALGQGGQSDGHEGRASVLGSRLSSSASKARPAVKGHVVPKTLSHTRTHCYACVGRTEGLEKRGAKEGALDWVVKIVRSLLGGKDLPNRRTSKGQGPDE